ncbi:MAG: cell division protein ZapB [Desulfosudaceae bacterium]
MREKDTEQVIAQFDEIENKISKLLEKVNELEAANQGLKQKVSQLERELEEKVAAENQFAEEKALIKSRVNGLLKKIDEFTAVSE